MNAPRAHLLAENSPARADLTGGPFALVVGATLVATIVCFGILKSAAGFETGDAVAAGAAAGLLIFLPAFTTVYLQLKAANRTEEKVREINQQLHAQLGELTQELERQRGRGVKIPVGWEREIDDRLRVALARPAGWQRGGGRLFEFTVDDSGPDDLFPARLTVSYAPLEGMTPEDHYRTVEQNLAAGISDLGGHYNSDVALIGGNDGVDAIRSLRVVLKAYATVAKSEDTLRRRPVIDWDWIGREEIRAYIERLYDNITRGGVDSGGLAGARAGANERKAFASWFDERLTRWEISSRQGVVATVEEALRAANGSSARAEPTDTPKAGAQGDGAGDAQGDGAGDEEANGLRPMHADIVPLGRIVVVSAKFDNAFYFDFIDDLADFPESSEQFNRLLQTIRFLD